VINVQAKLLAQENNTRSWHEAKELGTNDIGAVRVMTMDNPSVDTIAEAMLTDSVLGYPSLGFVN
jgi:hypothetical protein